ncbi:MAG: hypothetical protein ACD_65C00138G0003 [uncultured bacterium]|nr:MAG: hypothetical protein ACD_65C00138G0003 [uncultured bacterium]KKT02965.1 MAG: hypothetical protein UV80_C0001G0067 [Candidatus Peregrinibacteria bacterium GW2011_GWF2_43_17]KKT20486.1 MAG: hypothetical protein UW03_C0003G0022 [Candidatus Peregrinibacteria bacterium GW2011_GWA2_43_8]
MTSGLASHQHGYTKVNITRPKSKQRVKKNKAKARIKSVARQDAIKAAKQAFLENC